MKHTAFSILFLVSVSAAHAGSIDCQGITISDEGSQPARIILSYDSFPGKIRKLTVITEKSRSWKINDCLLLPESKCQHSAPINPNKPDYAVVAINLSGPSRTDELGLFIGKEKGDWMGYFWDGSIMNPEVEIVSCKVRK